MEFLCRARATGGRSMWHLLSTAAVHLLDNKTWDAKFAKNAWSVGDHSLAGHGHPQD